MSKQELIVGYDLCADYSQISYFDKEKTEPDSLTIDGMMQIPTVLFRRFTDGQWLAGKKALDEAQEGQGILVRNFTENIGNDPLVDVAGERMEKTELLCIFMEKTLSVLMDTMEDAAIAWLTVTMVKMDLAAAAALKEAAKRLQIPSNRIFMQGHRLSYEYYALSQRRELWMHDVGLFEYGKNGLYYHHLSISWKHHPASVTSESMALTDYLNGDELENPVGPEMDRKFLDAIKAATAGKTIATYYLVGEGFESAAKGSGWLNLSLQQLCAMRRHVFVGQNLYARGACYNSYYHASGKAPEFVPVNADLLMKEIYIRSVHRNTPRKVVLAAAGTAWYSIAGENHLIIDGCEQLVLHVRDTITNLEQTVVLPLAGLPERPSKTTKLQVLTSFESENICHVQVVDKGFGEMYPETGKRWEIAFDILDHAAETQNPAEQGSVMEATIPVEVRPFDMKLSGVRIYTLEELCRYLYENVYAITEETFNEKLLYWMDRITGSQALSQALHHFISAGKPLREMVRFLLNAVSYLSNSEIAFVYNKLAEMEKQNPIEQARMAADNYCRYGHYMAALKNYQHVIYQMNHGYEKESTRQFKAETWHNAGVTFMKLHNLASASACMHRAFELVKDQSYLESYMYTLQLMGAQDKMLEIAHRENIPASVMDGLMEKYRSADAFYESSECGMLMKAGIQLKQGQGHEEYQLFVKNYLANEKKKYELS
jgi:hypothetical protein